MTTKKQKRMAAEARQAERDAAHQAEIKQRALDAERRMKRRMKREAAQERAAQEAKAHKRNAQAINNGLRPS